jgi:hypothetical protein
MLDATERLARPVTSRGTIEARGKWAREVSMDLSEMRANIALTRWKSLEQRRRVRHAKAHSRQVRERTAAIQVRLEEQRRRLHGG